MVLTFSVMPCSHLSLWFCFVLIGIQGYILFCIFWFPQLVNWEEVIRLVHRSKQVWRLRIGLLESNHWLRRCSGLQVGTPCSQASPHLCIPFTWLDPSPHHLSLRGVESTASAAFLLEIYVILKCHQLLLLLLRFPRIVGSVDCLCLRN